MILKPIESKITLELTLEEVNEYNRMVEKMYVRKKGDATENESVNRCPACGHLFTEDMNYCGFCGQWVKFVKSDVLPL